MRANGRVVAALLAMLPACGSPVAPENLPPARQTMLEIARRLGRTRSPGDLTEAAKRGDRVLALLTRTERDALSRGAIRFRVDRPTVVTIATPKESAPFWLADQGFEATGETLRIDDVDADLYRKAFPAGSIGLGVNALDLRNPTHYAVFLRSEAGQDPRVAMIALPSPGTTPALEGVSPYLDGSRPLGPIPTSLVGSVVLRTDSTTALDGVLATGRVWKTHQPSGPKPDQIVASFGEDPTSELSFTWRTDPTVKASALLIAPQADPDAGRIEVGDAHTVESVGLLNDPIILRHRVIATGLKPATTYTYSVGDGSRDGWSPWHAIRTAPRAPRDFGFLYLGDAQCGLEKWGELLHAARERRPDAAFLLLAGDLVDRGNERTNWDHFFLRAAGVFEEIPFMPAVGNHEYLDRGPMIYRATFDLPRNGPGGVDPNLVYSFEYSDAFVAVLDSNLGIYDSTLAQAQAEWLDRKLAATKATWKFVTFHHPVHASHVSRSNPELGAAWGPVFRQASRRHGLARARPCVPPDQADVRRPTRRIDRRGDSVRRLGLRREVLRPGPARLHGQGDDQPRDLPDDRH